VSDLFGFLFLFLIEQETVEDATEENRFSAQIPSLIISRMPSAAFKAWASVLYFSTVPTVNPLLVLRPSEVGSHQR